MKFFAIISFVGYTQAFLVRREAAPEAEADADADAGYGYGAVSPAAVSAPVCNSVPEKVCKDRTIETPRKVCHTEHDEIVDTTITEHCEEVITTKCEQTSTQSRHSSAIVAQLLHLLPSVTVFPSEPATKSPSAPPGRSPRLSARKSLISRSSRIVLILSAPPALSNLYSSPILLLLLELTPGLDPKLLLLHTEPLLLELLLLLLLLEELLLPMVVLLPPLLPDMLAPELDLLDMLDINFSVSSLFMFPHYLICPTALV